MRLLRGRIRSGAALALFALAVQLVATFGHIHKEDFVLASAQGPAATLAVANRGTQAPVQPAHDDHGLTCSICASISLAGALLVPAPPAIIIALAPTETLTPASPAPVSNNRERRGFQARAPPA
jgi:hypothetical protein